MGSSPTAGTILLLRLMAGRLVLVHEIGVRVPEEHPIKELIMTRLVSRSLAIAIASIAAMLVIGILVL